MCMHGAYNYVDVSVDMAWLATSQRHCTTLHALHCTGRRCNAAQWLLQEKILAAGKHNFSLKITFTDV